MKNLNLLLLSLAFTACTSNTPVTTKESLTDKYTFEKLLEGKNYDIAITSIINHDGTSANLLPNTTMTNSGGISSTIKFDKGLEKGYYIRVRPDILQFKLPFSGKSRTASLSYNSNTVTKADVKQSKLIYNMVRRPNNSLIHIKFNERVEDLQYIEIEIDKKGSAIVKAKKVGERVEIYDGFLHN